MCGLNNTPATDVVFRRTFAGPGASSWSSCSHVFGAGRVSYEDMTCCRTTSNYPALIVDSSFCPDYTHGFITVKRLRWFRDATNLCASAGTAAGAVSAGAAGDAQGEGKGDIHWKESRLDTSELGCA